MHLQVLSSGSRGNSALVRAGELNLLVDAGLPRVAMEQRLECAGLGHLGLDHVLVTHGHLDHARSAGLLSRQHRATLHCSEALISNASIRRSKRLSVYRIGEDQDLGGASAPTGVRVRPVLLPHDALPTVAFRLEHAGRVCVVLTDMGRPDPGVAARLRGAHVLVLEFNHDAELLRSGPYPAPLKRRILGNAGHLSNEQAGEVLGALAGPELHTLVLAHLSQHNNTPELALAAACGKLAELGLDRVAVHVADQDEVGANLEV
ncbi:MAG TPA: MBL fold metallo-hydrolase [Myxococcota bacterium]|nr:MBL fold metallo-hydrolase [Myxococcota bacterium]